MDNVEALLENRWILKDQDREQYYKIKDHVKELRSFFQDKLGYNLIVHQQFIRLDKIPGKPEPWMGIQSFSTKQEYQMLCYVLVFLEDKEIEEQFILSHLTEFIQLQLGVNEDFWLKFTHRKMFVNVLKYCLQENLIIQDDGNSDYFIQNQNVEALFENTGLSRYFMRSFTTDVFDFETPMDVMLINLFDNQQDRGIMRRQRIYRRLLLSCGIYLEDETNDDFSYIRHYRRRIESDFQQLFPCELQVYRSSAFLILDEDIKVGDFFPKGNALDELVVICCSQIRKGIKNRDYKVNQYEIYQESIETIKKRLQIVILKQMDYLPSTYRQKKKEQLVELVYQRLLEIGFMEEFENNVLFYPVVAKMTGEFEGEKE